MFYGYNVAFSLISIIKYKYKKKRYLLSLKKQEIFLEIFLFNSFNYKIDIYLNNILNNLKFTKFLNHYENTLFLKKNKNKKIMLKRYNLLLYVYMYLKNINLFSAHIGSVLLKSNRHIKSIQFLLNRFYTLYYQQILNFKGLKLYISGKLNGKMKRQKYSYKIGKMLLNTLNFKVYYTFMPVYTKFGVFSVRIWLS